MTRSSITPIKILVMALPIGLVLLGALSFVFYLRNQSKLEGADSQNNEIAIMLRKKIDQASLEATIRTLSDTLGPRSVETHDTLQAAASFPRVFTRADEHGLRGGNVRATK